MNTGICACIPMKEAIAEMHSWRGVKPQECIIYIVSEISFFLWRYVSNQKNMWIWKWGAASLTITHNDLLSSASWALQG